MTPATRRTAYYEIRLYGTAEMFLLYARTAALDENHQH